MPKHAIPPGPAGRGHRRLARRRRRLAAWQRLPVALLVITCLQVAGVSEVQGSATSLVLGALRVGLVGGLLAVLVLVVVVALRPRLNAWSASAANPLPRWQYLLAAFGWLAIGSCFVLLSLRVGVGLPARASAALGMWFGIYGLVLIGRATSWGTVRALLWWGHVQGKPEPGSAQ
jgi:hypothetical protein